MLGMHLLKHYLFFFVGFICCNTPLASLKTTFILLLDGGGCSIGKLRQWQLALSLWVIAGIGDNSLCCEQRIGHWTKNKTKGRKKRRESKRSVGQHVIDYQRLKLGSVKRTDVQYIIVAPCIRSKSS